VDVRNDRVWGALIAVFLLLFLTASVQANLNFYTDRAAWQNALGTSYLTDDFESETAGAYTLPFTTSSGILFESVLGPISAFQILVPGVINGTQEVHVRDFSAQMRTSFPGGQPVSGFGFDWRTAVEDWDLQVGGSTVTLPHNSTGFLGVVDDTRSTVSFILTSSSFAQGGISVDNLAYGRAFDVYTDRASWRAALSTPILREDFESETFGTYPLPYTTAAGLVMTEVLGTITAFQIFAPGVVNGSLEMHVRDFGNQLSCGFPGAMPQLSSGSGSTGAPAPRRGSCGSGASSSRCRRVPPVSSASWIGGKRHRRSC
jgi:hypothetical protein